jgi:hypothetical protein
MACLQFSMNFCETDLSCRFIGFLGPAPDPVAPLRGEHGVVRSSAKQNNAFCFFFWKKKISILPGFLSGASPRPRGSASRRTWCSVVFCEAEQRFLLLLLEKEVYDTMVRVTMIWVYLCVAVLHNLLDDF